MSRIPFLLLGLLACGDREEEEGAVSFVEQTAVPIQELVVKRVSADLAKPEPFASYWANVTPGEISLLAQPMIAPRPETTTTERITVQAVHDGENIAFRLRWADPEPSEAGHLGEFSDAVALQFPIDVQQIPPVMMGAKDQPVHIFHWRAQYQRDAQKGKPEITDLYPNASIDMYPMAFKEAPSGTQREQEVFNPGIAMGNPQSFSKTGVDEIIAEGFSTSSVLEGHGSGGRGVWKDGAWTVVIVRPLVVDGGSSLSVGGKNLMSYAVWQGGLGEVGSRKCILMSWMPLQVM